jgi:hypothetical protein
MMSHDFGRVVAQSERMQSSLASLSKLNNETNNKLLLLRAADSTRHYPSDGEEDSEQMSSPSKKIYSIRQ